VILNRIAFVAALLLLAAEPEAADPKPDNLIVYGSGFAFAVREPAGWIGDTKRASEYGASVVLYPRGANPGQPNVALIRVLIARKADEDTAADLEHDMKGYRARFHGIRFKDIEVTHPSYRSFPKLFFVPGQFFEYITYLNPGADNPYLMSVSMNKQSQEATPSEFAAYQQVIGSLQLL
jgi:hypothetical protein